MIEEASHEDLCKSPPPHDILSLAAHCWDSRPSSDAEKQTHATFSRRGFMLVGTPAVEIEAITPATKKVTYQPEVRARVR